MPEAKGTKAFVGLQRVMSCLSMPGVKKIFDLLFKASASLSSNRMLNRLEKLIDYITASKGLFYRSADGEWPLDAQQCFIIAHQLISTNMPEDMAVTEYGYSNLHSAHVMSYCDHVRLFGHCQI